MNVTAFNLINNMTITGVINVDAPIILHEILFEDANIQENQPTLIKVRIIGGLDVSAKLFSSGFNGESTWNISDATSVNEYTLNIT